MILKMPEKFSKKNKKVIVNKFQKINGLLLFLLLGAIIIFSCKKDESKIPERIETVKNEKCSACHTNVTGFSESHNPKNIGCSSCHLGNPSALEKEAAHKNMILIPGNLQNAKETCGTVNCHPGIAERVDNSVMSTMSGVVSVNKFVFDEIIEPAGNFHVEKLGDSPAETHLKNLCASCHLGNEKKEFGPVTELSRGGGCNACHLNYSSDALVELIKYDSLKKAKADSVYLKFHPSLSIKVTNTHCFGCHSRSGRISTNYEGWHETDLTPEEIEGKDGYRKLADGRVFKFVEPDIHYRKGLACIDCHTSYELMGDGQSYEHKEQQLQINCVDCHFFGTPKTISGEELDYESKKIAKLSGSFDSNKQYLKIGKSNRALLNTFINDSGKPLLVTKLTKDTLELRPPNFECKAEVHKNLACRTCHTSWAPQCIGCHTAFEPETEGYDLLKNKPTKGSWVEFHGDYLAEFPVLGVKEKFGEKEIVTFIPGMILSIDKSKFTGKENDLIFKRLFAPAFSHTINKKAADCETCHLNPLAIGYGRGTLKFSENADSSAGSWQFIPEYAENGFDGLPEDAWIPFLRKPGGKNATRKNVRPFSVSEQKKILSVGACLTCHANDKKIKRAMLEDFEKVKSLMLPDCKIYFE